MNPIQKVFPLVLFPIMALVINACGFQLRGTVNASSEIKKLSINSGEWIFQGILENKLEQAGITISASAPYQLTVVSLSQDDRIASTSGGAIVTDYEVTATLVWTLKDESGTTLLPEQKLVRRGTWQRHINGYNASENARDILWTNLQQELAMALTRRLTALDHQELHQLQEQAHQGEQNTVSEDKPDTAPTEPKAQP